MTKLFLKCFYILHANLFSPSNGIRETQKLESVSDQIQHIGADPKAGGGGTNVIFDQISWNKHENEENWVGGRPKFVCSSLLQV